MPCGQLSRRSRISIPGRRIRQASISYFSLCDSLLPACLKSIVERVMGAQPKGLSPSSLTADPPVSATADGHLALRMCVTLGTVLLSMIASPGSQAYQSLQATGCKLHPPRLKLVPSLRQLSGNLNSCTRRQRYHISGHELLSSGRERR